MVPDDGEISRSAKLKEIEDVTESAGLYRGEISRYGTFVGKIRLKKVLSRIEGKKRKARFVAVTAITPYSLGLGKSVTTIALVQSLFHLGYGVIGAIRQPNLAVSLAGVKGGAAGGGYSQIVPMERLNTGLTGDEDRITNANNIAMALINALINRGLKEKNLPFEPKNLWFNSYAINAPDQGFREMLMSPRGDINGELYRRHGLITVATEIQGIMAMAKDYDDLLDRLGNIIIAPRNDGKGLLRFKDIYEHGIHHTLAGYLATSLRPNVMQTLNGAPFFVHHGTFSNISTGNNSLIADRIGLSLAKDVFVTECGFGSDCGFHKLWNIVGHSLGEFPDVAVIVYTLPGLKYHGGIVDIDKKLDKADPEALERGFSNLLFHIEHCSSYGIPVIPVHNKRPDDHEEDIDRLLDMLSKHSVKYLSHEGFSKGESGAIDFAKSVMEANVDMDKKKKGMLYHINAPLKEKVEDYIKSIGGDVRKITYSAEAEKMIRIVDSNDKFRKLPICPAKTHTSQTANPVVYDNSSTHKWVGRHDGFSVHIDEIRIMAGAGYIVVVMGGMRLLPGAIYDRCVVNKHYFDTSLPEERMLRGLD